MKRSQWNPLRPDRKEDHSGDYRSNNGSFGATVVLAAFAIGQITIIAFFPATSNSIDQLAFGELGLLVMLLGFIYYLTESIKTCGVATTSLLVLLGLFWLTRSGDTWLTAIVVVGSIGLLLYGTHRYELVKLDLVEHPPSRR